MLLRRALIGRGVGFCYIARACLTNGLAMAPVGNGVDLARGGAGPSYEHGTNVPLLRVEQIKDRHIAITGRRHLGAFKVGSIAQIALGALLGLEEVSRV